MSDPRQERDRPKVLLVGAGAVGQVYGYYLSRAGADITFLTKEKYAVAARDGFRLYRIPGFRLSGKGELRAPIPFDSFQVITRIEEVAAGQWDQVYLCMSTPALRSGWFPEFAGALNPETTLVLLPDGLEVREYVALHFPAERLVSGNVGFSSYSAPLPGETASAGPGTAYWLAAPAFSGPNGRADAVVALLRRGDFPAQCVPDVRAMAAVGESIAGMVVAALPIASWSFSSLARDHALLRATCAAARQTLAVSERMLHARVGAARLFLRPFLLRWALRIVPFLAPYLIEPFFRFHFTKVGDQIILTLETYARLARQLGLPADAIERLLALRREVGRLNAEPSGSPDA
jgi:2-dehydropantoate 2-reductase